MSEQQFREIQLSGKQLVFVFMTSVVLAVAVFLLGVSVGRGVAPREGEAIGLVDQVAGVEPPGELPPPTELTPADTEYHDDLLGAATPVAEPEPISEPVADDAGDAQAVLSADEPAPAPEPVVPAREASVSPATRTATARNADAWYVQVGAYRSRGNADRQVRELATKGYTALVVAPDSAGSLYRVRVGPFAERAEATRVEARLRSEEGLTPSLTR